MVEIYFIRLAAFNQVVEWCKEAEINENNFDKVLKHDQLVIERERNSSFTQVREDRIKHKPTYRRKRDTNDTFSNKKGQSPSYTDRILIKHRPHLYFYTENYNSVEEQFLSDHKPVVGVYYCQLIYNRIGFDNEIDLSHEIIRIDCRYAELNLDINLYFMYVKDYFPKVSSKTELYLRFLNNDYLYNNQYISSGTIFPDRDPNRSRYLFNFRGIRKIIAR